VPWRDVVGGRLGWLLLALTALAWIPPLVEELTRTTGNLTLLARFGAKGGGGYPLRTALAAVGAALSVVPLGARWVLAPQFQARLGAGPVWVVAWTLLLAAALVVTAVVGYRRGRGFAADLAVITLAALAAAVTAVARVQGEINFYLLTWISILPVPAVVAIGLALLPELRPDPVPAVAIGLAAVLLIGPVALHGTDQEYNREASATVTALAAETRSTLGPAATGLVRVHILTSSAWPVAAGVAVQLARAGARIKVDPGWVFLFGDQFRAGGAGGGAELWFALPHEEPLVSPVAGAVELAPAGGVDLFVRVTRPAASTSGT